MFDHEFTNFDDGKYIYENSHIQEGLTWKSVKWAFSADLLFDSPNADFWIPLTFLSHLLTVELFGMDPSGHHLVNLIFHVLNTVLLFWVLQRMTGALWASGFVAVLFGVHPLHVESVAWVTERKDVLSTLFWFLTMWAYLRYVERPGGMRYLCVALGLGLGLMAKPMLMTLPFVLLLLDYWPLRRMRLDDLGRIRQLVWEKIPLFVLVSLSIVITYLALEKGGHVQSLEGYPLGIRIGNALVSYLAYMGKMFWPSGLAVLYPHPGESIPFWKVMGSSILMLGITAVVVWRTRREPYLVVGWFWFLGTLVPTLGVVQVGLQSMADRYTYVPLIGLFLMTAWGVGNLARTWPYQRVLLSSVGVVVLSALMVCSWFQVHHWRNSITLFTHAINVTSQNYIAHLNLGSAFQKMNRLNEALVEYQIVVSIKPDFYLSHLGLGTSYHKLGKLKEAINAYQRALELNPDFAMAHYNLGNAYHQIGDPEEAVQSFRRTINLQPAFAMGYYQLGEIYIEQGHFDNAINAYLKTVQLKPDMAVAHHKLGLSYQTQGRLNEAIRAYQMALKLNPGSSGTHNNLGLVFAKMGQFDNAVQEFKTALSLDPQFSEARENLEWALRQIKKN